MTFNSVRSRYLIGVYNNYIHMVEILNVNNLILIPYGQSSMKNIIAITVYKETYICFKIQIHLFNYISAPQSLIKSSNL